MGPGDLGMGISGARGLGDGNRWSQGTGSME